MSLLPSADIFRSIELKVSQLLSGQLVCPHAPRERCSERADPAERTTDPHSLVDSASRLDDGYSPIRNESDIQMVDKVDASLWERISGERTGATLHRLGILGEFLASGSGQVPEGEPDELDGPQKEAE